MKYVQFDIENFKGIEKVKLDLSKTPGQRVFTLVGLNESGKTTVLDAINFFHYGCEKEESQSVQPLIPMSRRHNFNGKIRLAATLQPEYSDEISIQNFAIHELGFKSFSRIGSFTIAQEYVFKDSTCVSGASSWGIAFKGCKPDSTNETEITKSSDEELWSKLIHYTGRLLPRIVYLPNSLFDFSGRIYLEGAESDQAKNAFYKSVLQDVLDSLETGANLETDILARAKSEKPDDINAVAGLVRKMSRRAGDIVFSAWNQTFDRKVKKEITILCDRDERDDVFLEFFVQDSDGDGRITDRSLEFRWFFAFFLLTHFKKLRYGSSRNVLFLFDEPASGLHSSAQAKLLKSLERLGDNCTTIYTTNSQHLINPAWLDAAFVMVNFGLNDNSRIDEYSTKRTAITVETYRNFAASYPDQTSYFQPILDALSYRPSKLELIPYAVLVEGQNDYYVLNYMAKQLGKEIQILPCTNADSMKVFISLYLAWGRKFIIVLDSDRKGKTSKQRYIEDYGIALVNRVFTLDDVNTIWNNHDLEHLFKKDDLLALQCACFPEAKKYSKTKFNRAIQELFVRSDEERFLSKHTVQNFKKLFNFMILKLANA